MNLTVADWAAVVQAIGAVFTTIGVLASLYFSLRAMREVQLDRRQRQQPHLQFDRGGSHYPIKISRRGAGIPGIRPEAVQLLLPHLTEDALSVDLDFKESQDGRVEPFLVGQLKNFGLGPALHVSVTWVPLVVQVHGESFELDERKRAEPIYGAQLNKLPCVPAHILPGEHGGLSRLPTFINKDIDQKLSQVDGLLIISAVDVFGTPCKVHQRFSIFPHYTDTEPNLLITFGDQVL